MEEIQNIILSITNCSYNKIGSLLIDLANKNAILEEFESIMQKKLSSTPVNIKPTLIHTAGIPGCGKTTHCKKLLNNYDNFLFLAFDDIMEEISYYKKEKLIDSTLAFKRWEIPAKVIGYEILFKALTKKVSIIFEHSAAEFGHLNLLKAIKKEFGYQIEMHYLFATPEIVIPRVLERERQTKRHTPEKYIFDRYNSLNELLPKYKQIVDIYKEI